MLGCLQLSLSVDSGPAALRSRNDNEFTIMNCDLDGIYSVLNSTVLHNNYCIVVLYSFPIICTCMTLRCVFCHARGCGESGGAGRKDEAHKSGPGATTHFGR